ncbi:MAG: DNA polymerase IV, partial [Pseudomonadota bacterium]
FEDAARCPACGRPRVLSHDELFELNIAHIDCDAFYAAVEKRDDPSLADKPVIIGGGRRGVVSTACYIARIRGVRSAMPMFQALKLCPEAVVVRGRMEVYAAVSRQIRAAMEDLTPAVEPLSLDEAFLDLTGTARLHGAPPAVLLARLVRRIETELGITASVGLSHNKFLAKIASDLDKPQGFAVIGARETLAFLADKPVGLIWGIGAAGKSALEAAGIRTFADLRRWDRADLTARFGSIGGRLWHLARGEDARTVTPGGTPKSISNETTFADDVSDADLLDGHLWRMAEKVADRAKAKGLAGRVVTLKLKKADFSLLTRRQTLPEPTQMADRLYRAGRDLLASTPSGPAYRLLGIGLSEIVPADTADRTFTLLDPTEAARLDAERAADGIRQRFGTGAILKGRSLR